MPVDVNMNDDEIKQYGKKVEQTLRSKTPVDLAIGWLNYEALRKQTPIKFNEMYQQNLNGERFDTLVMKLVIQP